MYPGFLHLSSRGGVAMNRFLSILGCLALCSAPAFAQKAAGAATMTDQQFVDMAAQTDMVEANLGQMAQDAASSQSVKQYAQMLVTDHTADYKKLQSLAMQANVTVPTGIDAAHYKMMIAPFQKLKGKQFDTRYTREMVAGHTKAIAAYKKEADSATSPDIKSYAQDTIPTLQKHLDDAKAIQQGKTPPDMQ
jgi:putative membrane protein